MRSHSSLGFLGLLYAIGSSLPSVVHGADCVPAPAGIGTIYCMDFGSRNAVCAAAPCSITVKFKLKAQRDDGSTWVAPFTVRIDGLHDGMTPLEKAEQFFGGIPGNVAVKCRNGTTVCFQLAEGNPLSWIDILESTITEQQTGEDATVHALCEKPPHYQQRTVVFGITGTGEDPQGEAELGLSAPDPVATVPTRGMSGPQIAQRLAAVFNGLYNGTFWATAIGERVYIPSVPCERGVYGGASDPNFEWSIGMMAGDVLFYSGHGGLNEGHTQLAALYGGLGAVFIESEDAELPDLAPFKLVFISLPGIRNPSGFFNADEKLRINQWLQWDGTHRIVLIGEWGGVYGQGAAVLQDLCAAIGTGFFLQPQGFDDGCFSHQCSAVNTNDPLVRGLTGLCKSGAATWNGGIPISYPMEAPTMPWVVSHGGTAPCICGLGDSNTLSDVCGHLNEPNTAEFARRLFQVNCAGGTVSVQDTGADRPRMLEVEPNPARGATVIAYRAQEAVDSTLEIYNAAGQILRTIRGGIVEPGTHRLVWDGRDEAGRLAPSGIYLFSLQLGKTKLTGRSILIR